MTDRFRLVTTEVTANDAGASPLGAARAGLVKARLTYRYYAVGVSGEPEVQFGLGPRLLVCNHTDQGEGGRPGQVLETYGLVARLMGPNDYGPRGVLIANAFSDRSTGLCNQGECQTEDIGPMMTDDGPAHGFCRERPEGGYVWYLQWLDWPLADFAKLMSTRFPASAQPVVIVSYRLVGIDVIYRLVLKLSIPPIHTEGLTRS